MIWWLSTSKYGILQRTQLSQHQFQGPASKSCSFLVTVSHDINSFKCHPCEWPPNYGQKLDIFRMNMTPSDSRVFQHNPLSHCSSRHRGDSYSLKTSCCDNVGCWRKMTSTSSTKHIFQLKVKYSNSFSKLRGFWMGLYPINRNCFDRTLLLQIGGKL